MNARECLKDRSSWTARTAAAAFPVLLRRAMDGLPISYGDLKLQVEPNSTDKRARHYNYPAGRIGDICEMVAEEMGEHIPLLNFIIVNGTSKLPSSGVDSYMEGFLGLSPKTISNLSAGKRKVYAQQAVEAVLNFSGWPRVQKHLGIKLPKHNNVSVKTGPGITPPNPKKFSGGPESKAHKALKEWVKVHPEIFKKFGKFKEGDTEKGLSSGDRLDAYFQSNAARLAVEVKTIDAPDDEVQRGVYQCVKYRATLRAMQLAEGTLPNAQSVLVLNCSPSKKVSRLASLLAVEVIEVDDEF